ncbi:elongin-C-like [Toxorhynchites rutilus septentrionalis]|uniref:elongin-C-like n=1 Tax=Toxorhynchites rutilus septentrionalis TaxID=329112 RepID=UPI0024785F40|nr:elongin-C-like [Toxorhynchites rutilus septentrionalis]
MDAMEWDGMDLIEECDVEDTDLMNRIISNWNEVELGEESAITGTMEPNDSPGEDDDEDGEWVEEEESDTVSLKLDSSEDLDSNSFIGNEDCMGPDSMFVKLVSSEGEGFFVKREYAFVSSTIRRLLSGPGEFPVGEANAIHLKDFSSNVVKIVCKYLKYKHRYKGVDNETYEKIPEFPIPTKISCDLYMAAHFLDL